LHNQLKIRKVKINDIRFIYNLRNNHQTGLSSLNNKKNIKFAERITKKKLYFKYENIY